MAVTLPSGYRVLYNMITAKTRDSSTTSILELGCSNGRFVEYLRQRGYNAEGVDGDKISLEGRQTYLHHGELTDLGDIFGERQFYLIVARGIFCISSQMDHRFGSSVELRVEAAIARAMNPEDRKEIDDLMQKNIENILAGAYGQLTLGGFLMVREDVTPLDCVDFSKETAEDIGYIVKQLEKQQAILQKPLTK